jgi:hypothetical protein
MDVGLHVGSSAQRLDELGYVHPGAAVDLRGVFLGQHVDSHGTETTLPELGLPGIVFGR